MKKTIKIILIVLAVIAVAALCAWMIPFVLSLRDAEKRLAFENFVDSLGAFGVMLMLFIQVLQIVVAVIPGEPIELVMGLMYGTFGGLALTLAGILIGSAVIYLCVKRFGTGFAARFVDTKGFKKLSFLKDPAKRDSMIFLLFFIPGTPKDILTYFAPLTGIPLLRFLLIATLARIPSVVTSTFVGSSVSDGKLIKSLIVFALTGVLGLAGIYINNKITSSAEKKHSAKADGQSGTAEASANESDINSGGTASDMDSGEDKTAPSAKSSAETELSETATDEPTASGKPSAETELNEMREASSADIPAESLPEPGADKSSANPADINKDTKQRPGN